MPQNCSQLQPLQQTVKLIFMKYTPGCFAVFLIVLTTLVGCKKSGEEAFFETLLGKWQIDGRQIVETWQKSNKPDTLYTAQVVENIKGKFLLREQIFVTRGKDGQMYYNAQVKHQNSGKVTQFKVTEISATKAVFENPQHHFPQKITYELKDNNKTLVTEVSGSMDGEPQSFSFVHHQKK